MIALSKMMLCPSKMSSFPCGYGYPPTKDGKPNPNQLIVADRGDTIDKVLNDTRTTVFEFLHPDHPTKMYFDVDYTAEGEEDCQHEKANILNDAVQLILDAFPQLSTNDLCVCSYTGQDRSKNKRNTKFGKYIVSYHIVVDGCTIDRKDNKAVAEYLHEQCDYFDTTVYSGNQMFRFGGSHKYPKRETGCRSPKFVLYDAEKGWYELEPAHKMSKEERTELKYKNLITYTSPDASIIDIPECVSVAKPATPPEVKPTPPPPPATNNQTEVDEEILDILNRLPDTDLNEFKNWLFMTTLCKALDVQSTWDAWSKKSGKYDHTENHKHWDNIKGYDKFSDNAKRILTKRANKIQVDPTIWELHKTYEQNTDLVHGKVFVEHYGEYFKVVDEKLMYFYDKHTRLWIATTPNCILTFMMDGEYKKLTDEYVAELHAQPEVFFGKIPSDCQEPDKHYAKRISARQLLIKGSQMSKTLNAWSKMILADSKLRDPKFPYKLNSKRELLPVKNGMINLRDGTLTPRDYSHYCSQALDIEYNPDAKPEDNPHFMTFLHDIFDAEELDTQEVIDWFHWWMGYCITGYSNQEACCVYFGGGANGKSLLQEILVNIMKCDTGSMVDTWNYKIIDEASNAGNANGATPELAKMEGVRVGIINELADGMVLSEAFKRMVDSTEALAVRGLYQSAKTIAHMVVFNMLTNSFPHFKADYCYMRRIKVIPMLMKFCPDPEATNNPNARRVDTQLKQKMFASEPLRQGILAWFVQGAMHFLAEPKCLEKQPACCEKYKEQYVHLNDYMRLFEKSEDKKDRITLADAIEYIRSEFEKVPSQAELTEKFKELTGEEKTRKVEGSNGKRNIGFWYVKVVNVDDEEEEAEYAFK